jgi:hypothetical protein
VVVHAPTGVADAAAAEALAALGAAGATASGPIRVNFTISRSHVRYYHPQDAAAAATAAAALPPDPSGPGEARDFTDYAPRPAPGTLEVWLAGAPAAGPRQAAARPELRPAGIATRVTAREVLDEAGRDLRGLGRAAENTARRLERAIGGALDRVGGGN